MNQLGPTKLMEPDQAAGIVCLFDTKKEKNQLIINSSVPSYCDADAKSLL